MRLLRFGIALFVSLALVAGCSSSDNSTPQPDLGFNEAGVPIDRGIQPDQATPPADFGPPPDGAPPVGKLPDVAVQAGVVYLAHFLAPKLFVYRVDGPKPAFVKEIDLGSNKVVHDMEVDRYNDLLVMATDVTREVDIFKLSRPTGPGQPVADPVKVSTIKMPSEHTPRFIRFNPQKGRVYVFASPPAGAGGLVTEHYLHSYDITDPANPKPIGGAFPAKIPTTTAMAIDPAREVLFLSDGRDDTLHGYDLGNDGFAPLPGSPIDVRTFYPQEQKQIAFQLRNFKVDPWRNRLYAARAQGVLSELVVIEYPAALPAGATTYGALAKMSDLKPLGGPFDVNVAADQRPNLLGAFEPVIDFKRGDVFISAEAWNGMMSTAIMVSVSRDMKLAKGCDAFEGFGCWYTSFLDGKEGGKQITDGAACVDYTHRVVVGTSVSDEDPGTVHMFKVKADDLTMEPWLTAEGGNPKAGPFPIDAICH